MTFLEMARLTLEKINTPLTSDEIWDKGVEYGYARQVKSGGKTPQRTIGAQIYVNIRDDEKSYFQITSRRPTRFTLSAWNDNLLAVEPPPVVYKQAAMTFKEHELHQILAYFAYNYLNVLTRTIDDKKDKGGPKGRNEWLHPDMVGLEISSIKDFKKGVLSFSKQINQTPIRVFSFEIKRRIEFSNLRESYFQTVSNSRWASEGYLVCAEMDINDTELLNELSRLANSYGIGVIKLNLKNPDDSEVLCEAHFNESIEWDFVNYLYGLNKDYQLFIDASTDIMKAESLIREKFDRVMSREEIIASIDAFRKSEN